MSAARVVTLTELDATVRSELQRAMAFSDVERDAPFVLVSPLGLRLGRTLVDAVQGCSVRIARVEPCARFARVATAVYAHRAGERALWLARAYELAWQRSFPEDRGEVWWLADEADHGRLIAHKARLRRELAALPVTLVVPSGHHEGRLQPFHSSDIEHLAVETGRLRRMLHELTSALDPRSVRD